MLLPTLEEYLVCLPVDIVFQEFIDGQGVKRKILSSSLIRDAACQFASEKSLQARFGRLSAKSQLMVSAVYLAGMRGVPAPLISGFSDELLKSFLVFAGRSEQGATAYYGFSDLEAKIAPLCAAALTRAAGTKPSTPRPAFLPWYCLTDVVMIAIMATRGRLDKTKKGAFSRAAESCLDRLLHASRDAVGKGADAGRDACVSLLISYAVSRGLMAQLGNSYRVSNKKLAEWASSPLDKLHADFCEFAFDDALLFRRPVMDRLFDGPGKSWISTAGFPEAAKRDAEACALVLGYCGYLDVCASGTAIAFCAAPRRDVVALVRALPAKGVILLPDFSAVLSQETPPDDLYWFSKAGEITSLDKVYKGAISREVINNSLSEGIDGEALVGRLAGWKAPNNVLETVREWIREFSRVYVTDRGCIVSFDEKATRQILSYEPLSKLVTLVRPQSIFSIRRGCEEAVKGLLASMGFDPRAPGESEPPIVRAGFDLSPDRPPRITPVVSFSPEEGIQTRSVKAGKYGEKLKELDINDMLHVLDYAVLMGHGVVLEYRGSPRVNAGMYSVKPLAVHKAAEPFLEAETGPKKPKKKFLLAKIKRIGVGSP